MPLSSTQGTLKIICLSGSTILSKTPASTRSCLFSITGSSVEKTSVTIAAAGGSQAVSVTCTGNYTVSSDEAWLTVSKIGGVTITATANDATEQRKAKVTVTSSDNTSLTKTITVTQEAKPAEPATRSRR